MNLYFTFIFLILACQSLPIESIIDQVLLEESVVTDKYKNTEESTMVEQNEDNSGTGKLSENGFWRRTGLRNLNS